LSVTLSGAGPSVLLLVESKDGISAAKELIFKHADGEIEEIVECGIELKPAQSVCDSLATP
jgi:homoserine kinase